MIQICNREETVSSLGRGIITTVTVPLPYTYFPNNGLLMITFGTIFSALLTSLWVTNPVTSFLNEGALG